jgi:predicted nucleotidyltransferase
LSTAKVTYFDRAPVEEALERHVERLPERCPDIEEIVLFGSLVSGTPVPGSDVDLLIILSASAQPFVDRIPMFLPTAFPVGMDVFPYTRAEVERLKDEPNSIVRAALCTGRKLVSRPAAPPPTR